MEEMRRLNKEIKVRAHGLLPPHNNNSTTTSLPPTTIQPQLHQQLQLHFLQQQLNHNLITEERSNIDLSMAPPKKPLSAMAGPGRRLGDGKVVSAPKSSKVGPLQRTHVVSSS
jgi:hypothetical protein